MVTWGFDLASLCHRSKPGASSGSNATSNTCTQCGERCSLKGKLGAMTRWSAFRCRMGKSYTWDPPFHLEKEETEAPKFILSQQPDDNDVLTADPVHMGHTPSLTSGITSKEGRAWSPHLCCTCPQVRRHPHCTKTTNTLVHCKLSGEQYHEVSL